jgi:hypothetical protein
MKLIKLAGLIFLALLCITAAVLAGVIKEKPPSGTWRYKMTVEVETPEGIKSGSTVREVTIQDLAEPTNPSMGGFRTKVKGEAVVVDLGPRGVLFALLNGYAFGPDYAWQIVFHAFPMPGKPPGAGGATPEGLEYYSHLKAKTVLPPSLYPMMVTFADLKEPKTVKSVYDMHWNGRYPMHYETTADRFEETFGQGIRLKSIEIEMADESITQGIEKKLVWLPEYYNKRLDGHRFGTIKADLPIANNLSSGAFSAGAHLNGQ